MGNKRKITIYVLSCFVFSAGIFLVSLRTYATSQSVTQTAHTSTIAKLIAQVKNLQAEITALQYDLSYVSVAPYIFNKSFALGSRGPDVQALQKFLNVHAYLVAQSGPGSIGNETSYFGPATQRALAKFQAENNISPAMGYFGPKTIAAINPVQAQMKIVASSSNNIFAYPHGVTTIGDKIVIGTVKENPPHMVIFTNQNDLTQYIATTTPGFINLADVDYDMSHNKLYFVSSRVDNGHLEILGVDPNTLTWAPVFEFAAVADTGYSTIQTDGVYVYVATQSIPAYMIKVRISDWSLQAVNSFPTGPGFHSSVLHTYSDRTEWYVDTYSIPTVFYKVSVGDFSYTSATLANSGDITNDGYFRITGDKGGLLYITSENIFGIDVVNTATMSSTHYHTPASYGLFSDGIDLYSMDTNDYTMTEYPNFNIQKPLIIKSSEPHLTNEWFKTSDGKTYFTDFTNPSALYQYSITHNTTTTERTASAH